MSKTDEYHDEYKEGVELSSDTNILKFLDQARKQENQAQDEKSSWSTEDAREYISFQKNSPLFRKLLSDHPKLSLRSADAFEDHSEVILEYMTDNKVTSEALSVFIEAFEYYLTYKYKKIIAFQESFEEPLKGLPFLKIIPIISTTILIKSQ